MRRKLCGTILGFLLSTRLQNTWEKKDISDGYFLTQQVAGGSSTLSKDGKPILRHCSVKFRANVRIEVAETAVDRKIVQPKFAIPTAAVAIQMISVQFRDRQREHCPIRQDAPTCTKRNKKTTRFHLKSVVLRVEVAGFEPAAFWSRNPNRCFPMSYHARCCYKKESLSFDIIGHGRKHSVAI